MTMCLRQCYHCKNTVTVLLQARSDCLAFAMVAEQMMEENCTSDIGVIVRVDGFDVSAQCAHRQQAEQIDDCLF